MNTRASVAYGWGVLCLAGGGAYYFAKRSINADREERAALVEQQRQQRQRLRATETVLRDEKMHDTSATKLRSSESAPAEKAHEEGPNSKYEAKQPWRSRKGDRFS